MKTPLLLIYCMSVSYAQIDCSNTGKFRETSDRYKQNKNFDTY